LLLQCHVTNKSEINQESGQRVDNPGRDSVTSERESLPRAAAAL
jgi:hypothetical protein